MERTHENGTLRLANVGEKVTLVGWVAKRRNLGSLVFIDLRDRSGICLLYTSMEDGAYAALELSCHQLEICRYSPKYAVFLNLYEEHLDHYGTMEKYGLAKSHIFTNQMQGDTVIMHEEMKDFIKLSLNTPYLIGKDITAHGTTLCIPGHTLEDVYKRQHQHLTLTRAFQLRHQISNKLITT